IAEQVIIAAGSAGAGVIAVDDVITSTAVKLVAPDAAVYIIVAITAEGPIIAVGCVGVIRVDDIITISTLDVVVAATANDCVVPAVAIDYVVAVQTDDGVGDDSPGQCIRAVRARDDIQLVQKGDSLSWCMKLTHSRLPLSVFQH